MSKPDFSDINKSTTEAFNAQRNIIKDICKGKMVMCPVCNQTLSMVGPSTKKSDKPPGVYCKKGCTSIVLEFE